MDTPFVAPVVPTLSGCVHCPTVWCVHFQIYGCDPGEKDRLFKEFEGTAEEAWIAAVAWISDEGHVIEIEPTYISSDNSQDI